MTEQMMRILRIPQEVDDEVRISVEDEYIIQGNRDMWCSFCILSLARYIFEHTRRGIIQDVIFQVTTPVRYRMEEEP